MRPRPFLSFAGPALRVSGLASCLVLSSACTKVNEQPVAPAPAQIAASAPKEKTRPPAPRPKWETTFDEDEEAPPAPPSPPPAAPVETLNGDPEGLRREDLQKTLDAALPSLASCFDGAVGSVSVALSFDADPAGKAENIQISGADPTAKSCVSARVKALSLPRFAGKAVPVHFPISVQRTTTAAKPAEKASPSPAAAAGPPPVFINP